MHTVLVAKSLSSQEKALLKGLAAYWKQEGVPHRFLPALESDEPVGKESPLSSLIYDFKRWLFVCFSVFHLIVFKGARTFIVVGASPTLLYLPIYGLFYAKLIFYRTGDNFNYAKRRSVWQKDFSEVISPFCRWLFTVSADLVVTNSIFERDRVRGSKFCGKKQIVVVRPCVSCKEDYCEFDNESHEFFQSIGIPSAGFVFALSCTLADKGLNLFLRAIAQSEDDKCFAVLPERVFYSHQVHALITGLGLKERVIPIKSKFAHNPVSLAHCVVFCFNQNSYPDDLFQLNADKRAYLVSEQSPVKEVFNSNIINFDENSVESLSEAFSDLVRQRKIYNQTSFVGPGTFSAEIESFEAAISHV